MTLVWPAALRATVAAHAERGYPDEVCGLLIGEWQGERKLVREVVPVENVWEAAGEHHRRFKISPEVFLREERRAGTAGRAIVGFYHSHPDHLARPSEYDREHAWPWYSYIIVSVQKGRAADLTSWVLREDGSHFDAEEILPEVALPGE